MLGCVWLCALAILGVGFVLEELAPGGDATLGARMRPSDVDDEVGVADDAGEVAVLTVGGLYSEVRFPGA